MSRRLSFDLSVVAAAAALAASLLLYANRGQWLPAEVPTHWNAAMQVDAVTPRDRMLPMLLLLPGFMAAWTLLSLALPWLSPRPFSVESFRGTYNTIMLLVVLQMGWIHASVLVGFVWSAAGLFTRMLTAGVFLFLALFGNLLGKVRRNFWIGVRTPWTLANETVWNQTHRLAAWAFTAGGLAACVAALVHPLVGLAVGLTSLLATAGGTAVYSLVLYKRLEKEGRA